MHSGNERSFPTSLGLTTSVGITTLKQFNVLHNKIIRAMTYSSFRTKITPLYKKLNLLKLDEIYSLELGKIMHIFHSGNLPDNFNHFFTPVNQVHCHATRSATRGAYMWQMGHTKYGKRSLRHLGLRSGTRLIHLFMTAPSSHLKNSTEMYLSLPMMTDSMVLKHEYFMSTVYHFILPIAHFNFKLYISL